MKYRVNWQGQDLGEFTLEELRRRRQSGELRGTEWVWPEGGTEWKALDFILEPVAARQSNPPPLAAATGKKGWKRPWVWAVAILILLFVVGLAVLGVFAFRVAQRIRTTINQVTTGSSARLPVKPFVIQTNTPTEVSLRPKRKAFRVRQYLEGFKQNGPAGQPWTDNATLFVESWIEENYGDGTRTNLPPSRELSKKVLAAGCRDPLVLTVAGVSNGDVEQGTRQLKDAVPGYEQSSYKAYPRLYATISLATKLSGRASRVKELDVSALKLLEQAFKDGSLQPDDGADLGDIFDNGWAKSFFERNSTGVVYTVRAAGKSYEWLALTLEGDSEIKEAWRARGGGYANTVKQQGWDGFRDHLAKARTALTKAWKLRPELPLPASRMITVAMGDSDGEEMRVWFEQATALQFDHPRAWADYRWGLRPRWLGSHEAMLALGTAALDTGRFDTDVPRQFLEVVEGIESDEELPVGEHIYGRADLWPNLKKMYEGYINSTRDSDRLAIWRSDFAAIAYLADRHDVARKQLEALNWNPRGVSLKHWGRDLSAMTLEVAARTGSLRRQIDDAESARKNGDSARALKLYSQQATNNEADDRTRRFIKIQTSLTGLEQRLQTGEWVDFLPVDENDDNWTQAWGSNVRAGTNSLKIRSSASDGHLLYSRANVGPDFEARGEFEVVTSSGGAFQAGLVLGMVDFDTRFKSSHWFAFRMMGNGEKSGDVSFSKGWTQNWVTKPAKLNMDRNSFHFRFENRKATASVNDSEVFRDVALKNADFACDDFLVGVCAIRPGKESVIRYRNLQVRRITAQSMTKE